MAAGLPVVITPAVEIGLPDDVRPACLVASDAEAYAASVIELLGLTPSARRRVAECADLTRLGWRDCLSDLLPILQEAALDRYAARSVNLAPVAPGSA